MQIAYIETRFGIIANVMRVSNIGRNACVIDFCNSRLQ
jgi:hypothetical protein